MLTVCFTQREKLLGGFGRSREQKDVQVQPEYHLEEDIKINIAHASPSELVETKELKDAITQAIEMLPSRQRSVFLLWYYEQ